MNVHDRTNQLDWQAFCYAAGELNAPETEQFEALLADDQAAREALARAVELTQTIAAAESQCGDLVVPSSQRRAAWSTRLSWMAIGGLASVLLAMLWSGVIGPTYRTAERSLHAQSRQNLALAWYETRAEIANVREAGLWPMPAGGNDTDDEAAADFRADNSSLDEAPSWMTAAVIGLPHEADELDQSIGPFSSERLEN
jgi:hypothetical protein